MSLTKSARMNQGESAIPLIKGLVKPPECSGTTQGVTAGTLTELSGAPEQGLYLVVVEPPTIGSSSSVGRLFLGTQGAAQDQTLLRSHGINSIVCVGTPAFHRRAGGDGTFDYLEIQLLDLSSENLLTRLDEATSFVWDGVRRGRGVLVNCVFAQSRSAAVVVACLMQQKGWPLSQALAEVRRAQPTVHINPGFVAQLALYQDLGCQLPGETYCATGDGINVRAGATYRWFLLACGLKKGLGSTHLRNSDVATSCPGDAFGSKETGARLRENQRKSAPEQEAPNVLKPSMFRCKTCRHPLFSEGNIIDHLHPLVRAASNSIYASFGRHGDGSSWLAAKNAAAAIQSGAREKNKDKALRSVRLGCTREGRADTFSGTSRGSCSSVFTEPLEWITKTDGTRIFSRGSFDTEGKITCPGVRGMGVVCGGKLGAWSLDGKDCSCGAKVKPAVQFTLSRIERERYG